MPQEFNVLRCFSCQTFQVHQVKKAKKWNCKLCGEKQSILKVFGRGTGAECRGHTQKLNRLQGESKESVDLTTSCPLHDSLESAKPKQDGHGFFDVKNIGDDKGRWSKYINETNGRPSEEDQREVSTDSYTTDWNHYKASNKRTRQNRFGVPKNSKRRTCVEPEVCAEIGGSGGMNLYASENLPNCNRTTVNSTPSYRHVKCGSILTGHTKTSVFAPTFGKLCEDYKSADSKDMSQYKNGIGRPMHSIGDSDYGTQSMSPQFASVKKNSRINVEDPELCCGTENLCNNYISTNMHYKLTNAEENKEDTYLNLSPISVLSDVSVNMSSNSDQLKGDIFSTNSDKDVNSKSPCIGFDVKDSTHRKKQVKKTTTVNVNTNSKWVKFLSSEQESSDECSQEFEFEQKRKIHFTEYFS